ncbi:MAG: phosphate acetyltransferase [Actinomycetales bacterium]|nr:phosphate acetyltransferase [Actinomycetales bacterium]
MSDSLYLTSTTIRAGKAVVALGTLEILARQVGRLGVFRPIIAGPGTDDALITLLTDRYQLPVEATHALTYAQAGAFMDESGDARLVAHVMDAFIHAKEQYDFVLVVGSDFTGPSPSTELALNGRLAANMGSPVLAVVNGYELDEASISNAIDSSTGQLSRLGASLLATVVNRVDPDRIDTVRERLAHEPHRAPVYALRDLPVLSALTLEEVADGLGGEVLSGTAESLQREVEDYVAGSGHLQTLLPSLSDGALVITSGDRADIAVGTAASALSRDMPTPSGVVLTCGHRPDPMTRTLLEASGLPVIAVEPDTYRTLHALEGLRGEIRATSRRKIAAALGEFNAGVDVEELSSLIRLSHPEAVTPLMFSFGLLDRARANRQRIVLPEGTDDRILQAAEELVQANVVDIVLLGDPQAIQASAVASGVDLTGMEIIDPVTSPLRQEFASAYADLRAHKGVTLEAAFDTMADVSYFGTMLVHTGRVDGMVSGAAHTTAHTIRPALEIIRTTPEASLVSSSFLMCLPDRVLVFADCAVVPDPTAEQLADIAIGSAETARAFGVDPRVAMLSYSTGASGSGSDVEKVRAATALVAERRPDLPLAGPIQYDAAMDEAVGAAKMPGNAVAGHATVLIFPDLNTGNTTYKAVQRSAPAVAVGPVLQGLRKPVNDLSRGCTVPDIVNTIAITAVQAQQASGS